MTADAFNAGYDAFEMGWPLDMVPPFAADEERSAWVAGWHCAHEALMVTEAEAAQAWHDEQDLNTLFNER